jgi:formylmethanofuran dehydrogenase subunit E
MNFTVNSLFKDYVKNVKKSADFAVCEKCGESFVKKESTSNFCMACIRELQLDHVYSEYLDETRPDMEENE